MRVLVYGGRDFLPTKNAWDFIQKLLNEKGASTVVSGAAAGADSLGEAAAASLAVEIERHVADWKAHGRAAGFIRNKSMYDSGIDLAIQFPGGNGTKGMRGLLDRGGVPVIEYEE